MTPLMSVIGTLAAGVAGIFAGWLASHNIVPQAEVPAFTAALGVVIAGGILGAIAWIKANASTLTAHMAVVNASGVVKAVPLTAEGPMISTPPTPTEAKIAAVNAIDGVKVVAQTAPVPQVVSVPPITK